jgi:3-isopropylmalate/(R)-2-methylmalate dehydratase small subunit
MSMIEGTVWKFGDNVDTDVMVPGKYLIGDLSDIASHVMEGIRPGFADLASQGDIIVGGKNFGTGSSREMAPRAIQAAGIVAIVAESFARIFFRNCINVGLVPVECPTATEIEEGQRVRIDTEAGEVVVIDTGAIHTAIALPEEIGAILRAGGLEPFLEEQISQGAT